MTELKLISVDDGTFLPLTAEFLARYSLKVGDSILLQEEPDGFSLIVTATPNQNMPQRDETG